MGAIISTPKTTTTSTTKMATTSLTTSSTSKAVTITSTVLSSSSSSISSSAVSSASILSSSAIAAPTALTLSNTMLVLAPDANTGYSGTSGFKGYGIPYQLVIVPQSGVTLPQLSSTNNQTGNYGGIVLLNEVSYDYNGTWRSALTDAQFNQIYTYQQQFGVRMVRLNVYPGPQFGATTAIAGAGCCNAGVEQYLRINDTSAFPTAGLVAGANVSTQGLYHYPALVADANTTAFATFDPSSDGTFQGTTVAAVINNYSGRQQMVWFTSVSTEWSATSAYLQHAFIHWLTRGLFVGRRRIYFNTQIDDVHLITDMYYPNGSQFRLRPADLDAHVSWQSNIRTRLPKGSNYTVELGHNGNGDIEAAVSYQDSNNVVQSCVPDTAIEYGEQIDTALEFQKPLGTGTNIWPATPANYTWSLQCAKLDPLATWFTNSANLNNFMHISHTFSHSSLNNATYSDAYKEIQFNQKWLSQVGISNANFFSKGLIPPAITGLHNGDVIRAWLELGVKAVVGDNTRPILMSPLNEFWPLISNVSTNGYAGLEIMPRWATTIYYNCDTAECTTREWVNTSGGKGGFADLLVNAKAVNTWHLFGLRQDPFMFHQANLRQTDAATFTVGSQTGKLSLLMIWVETVLQEMYRLTNWPIITLKHDDLAQVFLNRMTLDQCNPSLTYQISNGKITGVTVGATNNKCGTSVPVTFPGTATTTAQGTTSEQIGNDPLTIWTKLTGSPVSFTLGSPVAL